MSKYFPFDTIPYQYGEYPQKQQSIQQAQEDTEAEDYLDRLVTESERSKNAHAEHIAAMLAEMKRVDDAIASENLCKANKQWDELQKHPFKYSKVSPRDDRINELQFQCALSPGERIELEYLLKLKWPES